MIDLIMAVLCTVALILLFKVFDRFKINTLQAIAVNYWTAAICGMAFLGNMGLVFDSTHVSQPWFIVAAILGMSFFIVFNLTGQTTIKYGVSTASIAMKLGLVIPVMLAFIVYKEPVTTLKVIGIILALGAVVLSSIKQEEGGGKGVTLALLPLLVFFGSGGCDSGVQYANKQFFLNGGEEAFVIFIFVFAAITGTSVVLYNIIVNKHKVELKNIVGGIALGIPNYFSLYFIMKAMVSSGLNSSTLFPVNNISTVAVATIFSVVLFKEKLSKLNLVGLGLGILSIVFIIMSK
jgi:drug/metabolite transporter (DMT)-like permease